MHKLMGSQPNYHMDVTEKQGVALMGRNHTVPPCSVGRRTGHASGPVGADRPRALQTTTDDADRRQCKNNTGPLGGPVIMKENWQ